MNGNLIYYSTNTFLSYFISENFYNSMHFVWCSPVFDPNVLDKLDIRRRIPPSSSPHTIFCALKKDIEMLDKHSSKILQNRIGLKQGAITNYGLGIIDEDELSKINYIIDQAEINEFRPLLYLIPEHIVNGRILRVPVDKSANPLSIEYQILDLRKNEFEIIEY